jgi:hypothetical protein
MSIERRIFVSAPLDERLNNDENAIKDGILKKIKDEGYIIERFFISGEAADLGWSFANVEFVISKCIGAIIIAFPRWTLEIENNQYHFTSEYVHYEGAIVKAHNLPLLIISDDRVQKRGITDTGGGQRICYLPKGSNTAWLNEEKFLNPFNLWLEKLKGKSDLFFGYCGQAEATANKIYKYLTGDLKLKVLDWAVNFTGGQSILQEIESAAKNCTGAIFLFTKDDPLNGSESIAAPRDNVIFEAGFFIQAKGKSKVLIICENGAKMPADLGGDIYISMENREQTGLIESALRKFVNHSL